MRASHVRPAGLAKRLHPTGMRPKVTPGSGSSKIRARPPTPTFTLVVDADEGRPYAVDRGSSEAGRRDEITMSTTRTSQSFPTFRYLAMPFRWFFRSRRRVLTTLAMLVAMLAAPPLWWSIQLVGLPDIGDPFDVEAFRSSRIPDVQNAFVLYQRARLAIPTADATARIGSSPAGHDDTMVEGDGVGPRLAGRKPRALELFRQGTERPNAQNLEERPNPFISEIRDELLWYVELSWLEASRLEEVGEMASAWDWYRAALRAAYHVGQRGSWYDRFWANARRRETSSRIETWAADPRTTPKILRRALDDVLTCEPLVPSESDSLRADYAFVESYLKDSGNPGRSRLFAWLRLSPRGPASLQIPPAWGSRIVHTSVLLATRAGAESTCDPPRAGQLAGVL